MVEEGASTGLLRLWLQSFKISTPYRYRYCFTQPRLFMGRLGKQSNPSNSVSALAPSGMAQTQHCKGTRLSKLRPYISCISRPHWAVMARIYCRGHIQNKLGLQFNKRA